MKACSSETSELILAKQATPVTRRQMLLGASSALGTSVMLAPQPALANPFIFFWRLITFVVRVGMRGAARAATRSVRLASQTIGSRSFKRRAVSTVDKLWTLHDIHSLTSMAGVVRDVDRHVYEAAKKYEAQAIWLDDARNIAQFQIWNTLDYAISGELYILVHDLDSGVTETRGPIEIVDLLPMSEMNNQPNLIDEVIIDEMHSTGTKILEPMMPEFDQSVGCSQIGPIVVAKRNEVRLRNHWS